MNFLVGPDMEKSILTVELMCMTWEYLSIFISFSTLTEPNFDTCTCPSCERLVIKYQLRKLKVLKSHATAKEQRKQNTYIQLVL